MRVPFVRSAQPRNLWVMRYFTRQWQLMALLTLFLLLTVGFQLGIPQWLRRFLDAVTAQAGWDQVSRFAIFYIVTSIPALCTRSRNWHKP